MVCGRDSCVCDCADCDIDWIDDGFHGICNCVNNMTDQVNSNNNISQEFQRPGSAPNNAASKTPSKADQLRLEKIQQLREKQNSERLKKLEELKEHAAAAAALRQDQETRRRRHFLELSKKDTERRLQAEERRKLAENERQTALMTKMSRMTSSMISQTKSNERKYAFGSCTPRLIENYDGFLWKSQYNLNLAPATAAGSSDSKQGARATSAQDLLSGNDDAGSGRYFFCGRRKTDLTPTIPIRRDNSQSRTSGRLSSRSMTRLDKFHTNTGPDRTPSPGLINNQRSKSTNQLFKLTRTELLRQEKAKKREGFSSAISTRPPSSLGTNSIMTSSTHSGVNMRSRPTRKPRPVSVHVTGISSNTPTSLEERKSKMEERNIQAKKLFDEKQQSARKSQDEKRNTPRPDDSKSSSTVNSNSNNIKSPESEKPIKKDFSTIKRATPKTKAKVEEKKSTTAGAAGTNNNETSKSATITTTPNSKSNKNQNPRKNIASSDTNNDTSKVIGSVDSSLTTNAIDNEKSAIISSSSLMENSNGSDSSVLVNKDKNDVVVHNLVDVNVDNSLITMDDEKDKDITTVEVKHDSQKEKEDNSEKNNIFVEIGQVKYNGVASPDEVHSDQVENKVNSASVNNEVETVKNLEPADTMTFDDDGKLLPNEQNNVLPTPTSTVPANVSLDTQQQPAATTPLANVTSPVVSTPNELQNNEESSTGSNKPKITSEEEAKAKLAEKRRLAREAQIAAALKLEEEARQEEERQRKEAEDAEREAIEARKAEEERLHRAILERERQEEEERKRQIEEENARIEKELADKEAAKEVERLRLEMEERLRREEEERVERRRRVEAIMSRTRKIDANRKNQENQQDNLKNIAQTQEEEPHPVISTSSMEDTMNLQNNSNYNNNTLINFNADENDSNELLNLNNTNNSNRTEQHLGAIGSDSANLQTATIEDLLS